MFRTLLNPTVSLHQFWFNAMALNEPQGQGLQDDAPCLLHGCISRLNKRAPAPPTTGTDHQSGTAIIRQQGCSVAGLRARTSKGFVAEFRQTD